MLSTLKKFLILLVLVIIFLGGGYWFFFRSKNTTPRQTLNTEEEEEKDWGNISGWFSSDTELIKLWKNHDFNYEQTQEWIDAKLTPTDAVFAFWLKNEKNLTPEEFLNSGNEETLREEWVNSDDYYSNTDNKENEEKVATLKTNIISRLNIWVTDYTVWNNSLEEEKKIETKEAVRKTIRDLRSSTLDDSQKLSSLKNLLENFCQVKEGDSDSSDEEIFSIRDPSTPSAFRKNKTSQNYQQILELCQRWENLEQEPDKWFSKKRQLTSEEIDWACQQIKKTDKHGKKIKILPAEQFSLVRESKGQENNSLFSKLLAVLQNKETELVFIPVKGSNSRWSLLIYERVTELFYHYDINEGENFEYSAPLLTDLLSEIKPSPKDGVDEQWWEKFVKSCLGRKSEDEYNSGIAVISIIERTIQLYNTNYRLTSENISKDNTTYTINRTSLGMVSNALGEFNFFETRKKWQERHLSDLI